MFNTGWINLLGQRIEPEEMRKVELFYSHIEKFGMEKTELFILAALGVLLALALLVSVTALAFGAVIWSAGELVRPEAERKTVSFFSSLQASRGFFWRILGLQILVTAGFAVLTLILSLPVFFLFEAGAAGRAIILLLLGLAIFIPAALMFGFMHLYGPVFIVLFDRKIREAISLSFNLIRKKLKESVILAAFLLGLSLLFILAQIFSIILFSIPVAVLIWVAVRLDLTLAAEVMSILSLALAVCFLLALHAGFAVFQSTAWVLAVKEMVRTIKSEKEEPALAVEPA